MALTHRDVAGIVAALYGLPNAPTVSWVYKSNPDANVYLGLVRIGRVLLVCMRGSFDLTDWLHDFDARPIVPLGRPEFGNVHAGMYGGTPEAWDIIRLYIRPGDFVIFTGHSLGAGRANLLAGHAVVAGVIPVLTLCWGEPRSGFSTMTRLLSSVPGVSYRDVGSAGAVDIVTTVPLPIGYEHRVNLIDVSGGPGVGLGDLVVDPFALHHFDLYWPATPSTPIPGS